MLGLFGFIPNQVQSEKTLRGIFLMFSIIPAFFAIGKAIALILYPLNRRKVLENERELAHRKESAVVSQ
jgi:Na+/melibiose symporter-like transporter